MDLVKVLTTLHEELDSLNAAIATLERLQRGDLGRGRPPRLVPSQAERAIRSSGKQPARRERRRP
jgi:hypothetical protein